MADVELVIKISEKTYAEIMAKDATTKAEAIICNGKRLPKGHGRLIDADILKKDDEVTKWITLNPVRTGKMLKAFSELFIKKIDATKTIIEADKESEE